MFRRLDKPSPKSVLEPSDDPAAPMWDRASVEELMRDIVSNPDHGQRSVAQSTFSLKLVRALERNTAQAEASGQVLIRLTQMLVVLTVVLTVLTVVLLVTA